jgi:5-hydroxyisourate hydrolase
MSQITTHVLDTSLGRPAANVPVVLEVQKADDVWQEMGRGTTDADGRVKDIAAGKPVTVGIHRLTFDTRSYFAARKIHGFYPSVIIAFEVRDTEGHYHIPLLLNPYGYSTYRGS